MSKGALDKWTEKRWASLWLSVPRGAPYTPAVAAWDKVFRAIPAFELAEGNDWKGCSLEQLKTLGGEVFLAPLADDESNDVIRAAIRFLRNTGRPVIRGIRKDRSWMRFAPIIYGTTADLISAVFADELPPIVAISEKAETILANIDCIAPLFTGPPPVDLVRLGSDSPAALRLKNRLVINADNPKGAAIARDALHENSGAASLIGITARHAHEHLQEVAASVRKISVEPEILSPVRRRFIRKHLS